MPRAAIGGGEILFIIGRRAGLEAEHFNLRPVGVFAFAKPQTRVDDAGVVINKSRVGRKQLGKLRKKSVRNGTVGAADEQPATVTLGERILCNPFVGQWIVEVVYFEGARVGHFDEVS